MTRPSDPRSSDLEQTIVEVDKTKHGQLLEILSYIEATCHHIDPDMYRIRPGDIETMSNLLVHGALHPRVAVSHDELRSVEILVAAAWTYSHRQKGNGLPGVRHEDFEKLTLWLDEAQQAILRSAGGRVTDLEK
jgi:hypothetical protein